MNSPLLSPLPEGRRVARVLLMLALSVCWTVRADPPGKDYKLVWADEFDGEQLDLTKWDYRGLGARRKAINTKDAVRLDGQGHLVITTSKAGDEYHTGMIATNGKFEPVFGYFECRVKFQSQQGHWSAFWLQAPTMGKVIGDPKTSGTEIDIFEYLAREPGLLQMNLHWDGYGKDHKHAGSKHKEPAMAEGWHVIGLEWTPEEYRFFLDGKEVWKTTSGVSHAKEFIILSMEVDKWGGDIATAKLPDSCEFDYVRVYQKAADAKK
ncbi:MAG: glycoside hydrolase family 16 protein [Planctomycetota bacterium]|nr:glycoside hydrolase family 16 protein [Planctomycetota bacterium]